MSKRHPIRYVRLFTIPLLWLVLCVAMFTPGCQSPQGGSSNRMASVMIANRSREEIATVTKDVFRAHSYQILRNGPDEYVFEKEGTGMNTFVYGGLSGEAVWVRVKLVLHEQSPGETLVECDAYIIRGHGNKFFEEEQKLPKFQHGPYQELLDQIKMRLH
jgi:hypothetical protein